MSNSTKIVLTPAEEALYAFDAEIGAEPFRVTAEKIMGMWETHDLLDEISRALEDAYEYGVKRAPYLAAAEKDRSQ